MKIGTLLTAAIVSLSIVGGGLAAFVAVTKYQTMDKISVAQSRLEVVRAVSEIPRYMNPERGFATNILYGPATVDPKMRTDLVDKYRKDTDGARDRMNAMRKDLSSALDDSATVGSSIDAMNSNSPRSAKPSTRRSTALPMPARTRPRKSSPITRCSTPP